MKFNYMDFLYCYDVKLSNYLKKNGICYILKARSIKDGHIFTMYQKTKELEVLINEYNSLLNLKK